MTEKVNADGSTTYRNVTDQDYEIPRTPRITDPALAGLGNDLAIPNDINPNIMQQLANQADANGVVSEQAVLRWMKGQGILPDGSQNRNDATRQGFLENCADGSIADIIQQIRDNAKYAVHEGLITEITVPAVPNTCATLRVK